MFQSVSMKLDCFPAHIFPIGSPLSLHMYTHSLLEMSGSKYVWSNLYSFLGGPRSYSSILTHSMGSENYYCNGIWHNEYFHFSEGCDWWGSEIVPSLWWNWQVKKKILGTIRAKIPNSFIMFYFLTHSCPIKWHQPVFNVSMNSTEFSLETLKKRI